MQPKLKSTFFITTAFCIASFQTQATEFNVYGDALLRYENGFDYDSLSKRERLRFIGHLGLKTILSEGWFVDTRLSTGLKNKQNVSAITVVRFNQQTLPDKDIYFDRMYAGFNNQAWTVKVGKVPWSLKRNTDLFWDKDLHPYGILAKYRLGEDQLVEGGLIMPLDGQTSTVGRLSYLSYSHSFNQQQLRWTISPWLADYQGGTGATYATRDTQFDNLSLRLAITAQWQQWQFGVDLGHSVDDFAVAQAFADEKTAWALALQYGSLKKKGSYQAHFRLMHVERFGVLAEFAQNGLSRFATTNFEGAEVRYRYKLSDSWWLGTRYSYSRTLVGPQEQGNRFRFETQVVF